MTVPIKVLALNGTRNIPVNVFNEQAIYPSLPSGMAVLRYIPQTDDVWVTGVNEVYVQGEVYDTANEMIQYLPYTVECTFKDVAYVNIYAKKQAGTTYFMVGKKIPYTDILTFALLDTDFALGDDIDVKVEDYDNANTFDTIQGHIYSTITIDTLPTETPLATNFTANGKANCAFVDVTFSSATGEVEYTIAVVNGVWTKSDLHLLTADGFVPNQLISVMVKDSNDPLSYIEQIGVITIVPTMTIDEPIKLVAGVQKAVTGESDYVGQHVILESRTSAVDETPAGEWTEEGQDTVDADGLWSIDVTIAVASTRDFRLIDENLDPAVCYAYVGDVEIVSGVIVPVNEIYTSFDVTFSPAAGMALCVDSTGDYLIMSGRNSSSYTQSRRVNESGSALSLVVNSNTNGMLEYHDSVTVDANYFHSIISYGPHVYVTKYTSAAINTFFLSVSPSGNLWGIFSIAGVVHILCSNKKIYSCNANYTIWTEVMDLSALTIGDATHQMTYDSVNNIVYFMLTAKVIQPIDWATKTLLPQITITDSAYYGIAHFKGRLWYGLYKNSTTITIKALKNNNDA